ncbi:DUF3606 domain-containing protein [uncultured Fluviicola sp.]|uniref:DUF3606 domain-containing protein n=1 Tax=uncultured Fluviicola sp. TaxID=463303 RepID=UPI0025D8C83D|nr:DUF3606 domain-containing protein [uncultured Fluviicola sp.]
MTDNKKNTGSPDNKRIDVKDPNELRNWAKSLNTTQTAIKNAVAKVGTSAAAVKKELGKN